MRLDRGLDQLSRGDAKWLDRESLASGMGIGRFHAFGDS
jgi:hypothetical protein